MIMGKTVSAFLGSPYWSTSCIFVFLQTPVDGVCPVGSYCPLGSAFPLPCPPGTFSNATGLDQPHLCVACPPGLYCSGSNNSSPTGPCSPGYFCSTGASTPDQHEVAVGHYSLQGAFRPESCPFGTFQPAVGQSLCLDCLRGHFCNQTGLGHSLPCPPGHYCPSGSILPTACPAGSYSSVKAAEAADWCRLCDTGMFCDRAGLTAPSGYCQPGFYCSGAADTPKPNAMAEPFSRNKQKLETGKQGNKVEVRGGSHYQEDKSTTKKITVKQTHKRKGHTRQSKPKN
ncbi:signal peptide, CUB and EGF-like domain-containing protein 2 [Erpetoichthys calabaricus]|uniref:signal peptide, CUB and EGF-like domain-containing protein 2 n=1 Tax=Erpetoichthys calabaricus TaxID=27687 RepID=UPI0022348257|nr:signal peptide, CUB and EGF-like domain-containing protein 2 [Erpetoichthys calabaricus]